MAKLGKLISILYTILILLIINFKFIAAVPVEPVCSKFSYDEQLLEKMVRMEFFVENMKKDVDISASNIVDMLINVQANNSELSIRFSEMQERIDNLVRKADVISGTMANKSIVSENMKNIQNTRIDVENLKKNMKESATAFDALKTVSDEIKIQFENRFVDLSNKVAAVEKKVTDLVPAMEEKRAMAFNVMDAVSYEGKSPIKFSKIILNEGNAYNIETGIFTAPIDGIYLFIGHICCKKGVSEIEYYIQVNGISIVTGEYTVPDTASDAKCTSFSAAALVRKDVNVTVGGMPFNSLDEATNDQCSFSGTLIQTV